MFVCSNAPYLRASDSKKVNVYAAASAAGEEISRTGGRQRHSSKDKAELQGGKGKVEKGSQVLVLLFGPGWLDDVMVMVMIVNMMIMKSK